MNRRELMRLVDEGVAIVESLSGGELSRRDEMKAVDRMLEVIDLLGGDAGEPAKTIDLSKFMVRITNQPISAEGKTIPADWIVLNATRPIIGDMNWMGDFLAGRFYAAIDPKGEYAQSMLSKNEGLDARMVVSLDDGTINNMYLNKLPAPMLERVLGYLNNPASRKTLETKDSLLKLQNLPHQEFTSLLKKSQGNNLVPDISGAGGAVQPEPEPATNPLYQSVLDGAEVTIELVKQVRAEGQKAPDHPQLRPAVRVLHGAVKAMAA